MGADPEGARQGRHGGVPGADGRADGARASYTVAEGLEWFGQMVAGKLPPVSVEGGGGHRRIGVLCGFLGCDALPFNPVLATLPRGGPVCYYQALLWSMLRLPDLGGEERAELRRRLLAFYAGSEEAQVAFEHAQIHDRNGEPDRAMI